MRRTVTQPIYDDPTRFDITRDEPPPILTFGGGVHYCLGANLAGWNSPKHSRSFLSASESSPRGNGAVETTARPEWADEPADRVRLMSNTIDPPRPVVETREVIPLRERKLGHLLLGFLSGQRHLRDLPGGHRADRHPRPGQLHLPDLASCVHDRLPALVLREIRPLLYERPVWYTTIVWIDQVVYGPFYIAALYAFWKGKEWIRNWSIIWAAVMLATVTIILGEEIAGPFATDHLPLVLATNAGWLIVPIWVLIRMWREHPFTRPVTTKGES